MSAPAAVKAAARIDWSALSTKLKPETMASVNSFRRRHSDLLKTVTDRVSTKSHIDLLATRVFSRIKRSLKRPSVPSKASVLLPSIV
ncbi:hypothetical protein BASA84_001744 [Batrachochytrium salamandrivorans]|nr:hypothetical protein BASA84_001744 [Batrachochytrium salamandrivorans]